jgi:hypothetical protein
MELEAVAIESEYLFYLISMLNKAFTVVDNRQGALNKARRT